ncbi:MAG TPA: hypothetical protein VL614_14860 [Acetobacteraceae bacterium]|jgi:hypothetical protein|nr:hypothetical protein [Acetobacteraceae bacterium]
MSGFDLDLEWSGDLVLSPAGTLQTVTGLPRVRQRIIRRFLSNSAQQLPDGTFTPPTYLFDTTYGIGGGALVSQNPTRAWRNSLIAKITQAVLSDTDVDPGVQPQVVIQQPQPNMMMIYVGFQLITGQSGSFGLQIG